MHVACLLGQEVMIRRESLKVQRLELEVLALLGEVSLPPRIYSG